MDYDPASITQTEISAFADRFTSNELLAIRNASQDAMLLSKGEVTVTSLGLGGTNGSGTITGKPRYLMVLATKAIEYQTDGTGQQGMATAFNFNQRRMET